MKKFFLVLFLGILLLAMTSCGGTLGESAEVDKTVGKQEYARLVADGAKSARQFGDFYVLDIPHQGFAPYSDQGGLVAKILAAFEEESGLKVIAFYPLHNGETLRTYQVVVKVTRKT